MAEDCLCISTAARDRGGRGGGEGVLDDRELAASSFAFFAAFGLNSGLPANVDLQL